MIVCAFGCLFSIDGRRLVIYERKFNTGGSMLQNLCKSGKVLERKHMQVKRNRKKVGFIT